MNIALQVWGQVIPWVESVYTTQREDNGPYWQNDDVDPLVVAATLVDDWEIVDAFQGAMACQRTACPDGIVTAPGDQRMVVIVVVDDGARWVIVDAGSGEVLKSDESPVTP